MPSELAIGVRRPPGALKRMLVAIILLEEEGRTSK